MGRYYKNPDPDFVKPEEFLFKPPWEEIKAGLKFMDETIKETEQKQDEFSTVLGSIKYNAESEVDKALYENVYNQYKSALSEVQDSTVNNPNDWRSQVTKMRRLSNNLKEDLNKGTLSKIQERKQALDAFDANYKSTLDPTVFNKAREYYLNQVNQELASGNYEAQFSKEAVMNKRDLNKEFMEYLKQKLDLPNESSINGYGENGQFMYTKNGSTRSVSRQDIENMYKDFLNADAKPYLEYMTKIGVGNYIKDGEVNMDDRELKSGMEFMGGYNYNQTKSTVDADYSLGARTAAEQSTILFKHNLDEQSKAADRAASAAATIEAARIEAGANAVIEPDRFMQSGPIKNLGASLVLEISSNIEKANLTPQAKAKANHAYVTALLSASGTGNTLEAIKKLKPEEQQKIYTKIINNLTPEQSVAFTRNYANKVAVIPSLANLSVSANYVSNRARLNADAVKSPQLKVNTKNTSELLGLDENLVHERVLDTRKAYSSPKDLYGKKVMVVANTTGKGKLPNDGIIGHRVFGKNIFTGSTADGAVSLSPENNLNMAEGIWIANGKYPAGDPRNVSYAIPGTVDGKSVLMLIENGPGGIPFGPIR